MSSEKTYSEPGHDDIQRPRPEGQFCHALSAQFEELLDEYGGDPRAALGAQAIDMAAQNGGAYVPSWDDRTPPEVWPADRLEK